MRSSVKTQGRKDMAARKAATPVHAGVTAAGQGPLGALKRSQQGLVMMMTLILLVVMALGTAVAVRLSLTTDMVGANLRARTLAFQAAVFAELIRKGKFRPADPEALALAFWGPVLAILVAAEEPGREPEAQRLLESTDLTVEQVASTCGFGSAVTLRQAFARALGTTPSAYRRRFRTASPDLADV